MGYLNLALNNLALRFVKGLLQEKDHTMGVCPWPCSHVACEQALHLGELWEVTQVQHVKEAVSTRGILSRFALLTTRGGGVLPYIGYIGMCRCEGYGFHAVYSRIGYINQNIWV